MHIYVNLLRTEPNGVKVKHIQFIQFLKKTELKWQKQIAIPT